VEASRAAPRPTAQKEEWVTCPECSKKLAKKIGKGKYQTRMRLRKGKYYEATITIGEVRCPRCGFVLKILGVPQRHLSNRGEENA
jgi:DNA-directed RNA polymerase subunit RPC12/RpoP